MVMSMTVLANGQETIQPKTDLERYAESLELDVVRLERDLLFAHIEADSAQTLNSLKIGWLEREIDENGRHWYDDHRLWFVAGAVAYALMVNVSISVAR